MKLRWMNVRDRAGGAELLRLSPFCAVLTERGALCASAQLHLARAEVLHCAEQRPSEEPRLRHLHNAELPTSTTANSEETGWWETKGSNF